MKRSSKKQMTSEKLHEIEAENAQCTAALKKELAENPEFSLEVDPTDRYNMNATQKAFIKNYCEFKSVPMAAELCGIDLDSAKSYFVAWSSQQEIRRINRAMYQRQFSHKILSIDEISGYLSSLIVDDDVPLADRVKTMDKVKIAQMLIDLQIQKNDALHNPSSIIDADIEGEIKKLSVNSIKELLSQKKKSSDEETLDIQNDGSLLPEEEAFLKTLPAKDLLELIESEKNGGSKR